MSHGGEGPKEITVDDEADVLGLKVCIFNETGIEPQYQRLIVMGRELNDENARITDTNIFDGCTIHLVKRTPPPDYQSIPVNQQQPNTAHSVQNNGFPNANAYQNFNNPPIQRPEAQLFTPLVRLVAELSKFVQIFALIDTFLVVYLAFQTWPTIMIGVAATISGYFGARTLKTRLILIYAAFIVAHIGLRIYFITLYGDTVALIFQILILLIEPYIFRIVLMLYRKIHELSPQERGFVLMFNQRSLLSR